MRVDRLTLIHPAYALDHGEEGQGWVLFVKDAQGLGFFCVAMRVQNILGDPPPPPIAKASHQVAVRIK